MYVSCIVINWVIFGRRIYVRRPLYPRPVLYYIKHVIISAGDIFNIRSFFFLEFLLTQRNKTKVWTLRKVTRPLYSSHVKMACMKVHSLCTKQIILKTQVHTSHWSKFFWDRVSGKVCFAWP